MVHSHSSSNSSELSERHALLILNALPSIGPISCKRLLSAFSGDARKVFQVDRKTLLRVQGIGEVAVEKILNWSAYFDLNKEEQFMQDRSISFCLIKDDGYPNLLKKIYDPPIGLYCLGNKAIFKKPSVAIVGTRLASLYGKNQARKIASSLAKLGFCIVSGLARGIDYEAHSGALAVGGSSIAVLGNGLDIIYPPEHHDLYQSLEKEGLIVSEFPFGRRADRQSFPMRNRIIAGLSEGTIVIESGVKGGSLITANFALEYGRAVFAIPGRLDALQSQGCLALIKEGATMLTSLKDITNELQHFERIQAVGFNNTISSRGELSDLEQELFSLFLDGSRFTPSALAEHLYRNMSELNATLIQLELKNYIKRSLDGYYEINNI